MGESNIQGDFATRRFFFVHIMKTGGTTFLHQLFRNFAPDEVYPNNALDCPKDRLWQHLQVAYLLGLSEERRRRIRAYTGHFPYVVCELLDLDLVTLTVLRDPIDRTVSLLHQLRRDAPRHKDAALEDIYEDEVVFPRLIQNHQTKIFSITASDGVKTFRDEVEIDADRLLLAKRNLAQVDVIGVTEQYDEFLDQLEHRFGWRFDRDLRANETAGAPDATPALRRRIADDNQLDLDLYDYARDLMKARSTAGDATHGQPAEAD